MIGNLIVTHGGLARELLGAAEKIAGSMPAFRSLCLDWDDTFEVARARVGEALEGLDQGEGILILTDMFGGTPYNVAVTFHTPGSIELVTGVNLPMVLRLGCSSKLQLTVAELAEWIRDKGKSSICTATRMGSGASLAVSQPPPEVHPPLPVPMAGGLRKT